MDKAESDVAAGTDALSSAPTPGDLAAIDEEGADEGPDESVMPPEEGQPPGVTGLVVGDASSSPRETGASDDPTHPESAGQTGWQGPAPEDIPEVIPEADSPEVAREWEESDPMEGPSPTG